MPIYYGPSKASLPGIDKVYYGSDLKYTSEPPIDYLRFTANTSGSTIYLSNSSNTPNCEYSPDEGEHWYTFPTTSSGKFTFSDVGQSIIVRGDNSGGWSSSNKKYSVFVMTGSIAGSGNIMTLIDQVGQETVIPCSYCFYSLFSTSKLTSPPLLPATTLATYCYNSMFQSSSSLKVRNTAAEGATPFFTCPTVVSGSVTNMFKYTGGTFTGNPVAGTTYYWYT